MIAIDTNILVYAHRRDSQWHGGASQLLRQLAEGHEPWGVPWPCVHEFLAIVTHPRIYNPPTPLAKALEQVDAWLESPSVRPLGEFQDHWRVLKEILAAGKLTGGAVHDARVAAICRENGVRLLWSADRDFTRFAGFPVQNPLLG